MENIDFLPERIRLQRARRARLLRQVHLLAVCAAALVLLGYVRQGRISKVRGEVAMLTERAANTRQQLTERNHLEKQLAEMMIMKRIDDDLGSRADALDVLAALHRILPESMALTDLNLETMEVQVPVEGADTRNHSSRAVAAGSTRGSKTRTVKRVRLQINGIAPTDVDVANFIGQLSASPLFEDVNMGYARNTTIRERTAREFQVSCYVVR